MRRLLPALLALAIVLLFLGAGTAAAHGMRTASLRIEELAPGRALVTWQEGVRDDHARPVFPSGCQASAPSESEDKQRSFVLECDGGLAGKTFGVEGLGPILTDATVWVGFKDGRTASHLLGPDQPTWQLPRVQTAGEVSRSYVALGVRHILTGADHLLFLVLLVLTLRSTRAVLMAETAFTLSHSLSFSATALGLIHVPAPPAEACIALSLILLALDVKYGSKEPGVSARKGALAALVFGLVHGLGFAGGLADLGLPDKHVSLALLGFGAGVEIGQVAFLALALVVVWALARWSDRVRRPFFPMAARLVTVATGSLATLWLGQRLWVCFAQ